MDTATEAERIEALKAKVQTAHETVDPDAPKDKVFAVWGIIRASSRRDAQETLRAISKEHGLTISLAPEKGRA